MEYWSRRIARSFFHDKHILDWSHFHLVYWDGLERVMHSFPQMFHTFVTKHVSKFCGTNRQLSRYDDTVENVCPSCGRRDESATHITRCTDTGRREMLANSVDDLVRWMSTTPVEHKLEWMIERYLLAQDILAWSDCLRGHSPLLSALAEAQDKLGWDNFVAGRISRMFLEVVAPYLSAPRSCLTPAKWCQTLQSKLLQLTHKQWIF